MLVGDAAGLADALWGEGISYALMSGQIAALTIEDFFAGLVPSLDAYTLRIQNTLARDLRVLFGIAHLVYGVPALTFPLFARSPYLQRIAAGIVSGNRAFNRVWRCPCAIESRGAAGMGRCDPVVRTLGGNCLPTRNLACCKTHLGA
jgi:hypothetical protein